MFKVIVGFFLLANLALTINCADLEQEKAGPVCEICTVVLSAAQNLLEQNKTETELIHFLEKNLCGRLGGLNASCVQYMEAYGKTILYELGQKISPSVICSHMGLCSAQTILTPLPPVIQEASSLNCTLCKVTMAQAQKMLESNATEAQIVQFIENKVCNATGTMSQVCKTIVDTYGPAIMEFIGKKIDPEKICTLIGMCSNSTLTGLNLNVAPVLINQNNVADKPFCSACELVVQFAERQVQENKTEQYILNELKMVCKIAPPSMRDECSAIVQTYGTYIIGLLVNYADPAKVCGLVKLC